MQWYLRVLRHYVDFSGRARRSEFWMFSLINFAIGFILAIPAYVVFANQHGEFDAAFIQRFQTAALLANLYSLGVLIPSLGVQVRRLHDIGRSGWWYFIVLVPFVGVIVLLIFNCMDSDVGPNRWGGNPKGPSAGASAALA